MTLRVHFIQHAEGEGPGAVAGWAAARGHRLAGSHPYRGDPLPAPGDFDLLVVLGGGMSVHQVDRHPWLAGEKRLIAEAVGSGTPLLGICLGSQLVAEVLGAEVARLPEAEIGWFPVSQYAPWLPPLPAEVFHWHEDAWTLPHGAVRIAASAGCENQAFAHGDRVVGVQFHPEMTDEIAAAIVAAEGDSLPAGRRVQDPAAILADPARFAAVHPWLHALLDHLAGRAGLPAAAAPEARR